MPKPSPKRANNALIGFLPSYSAFYDAGFRSLDIPPWNILRVAACGSYLPGLEMILSTELYSADICWRQMLFEQLHKLNADYLLVIVPGYPVRGL